MEYTIALSENHLYVEVIVVGEVDRHSAMAMNVEVHQFGRERGISHFLMDMRRARNVESITGNYRFSYNDMQHEEVINRFARVVVLVEPDDHSHDFIETLARNTGMDVTLLRDKDAALVHLLMDLGRESETEDEAPVT